MKLKRVLVTLISVLMLICISVTDVSACLYPQDGESASELENDIRYWHQGVIPADNSLITGQAGSDTIGQGACSHFAMTYALVKMGIFDPSKGDTPITHIQNARDKNAFLTEWGYFDFSRVNELYSNVTYEGRDNNVSGMGETEGLAYVKGKMNEGYFVVGIVYGNLTSGHCIFFDGINEDGTTSIGDSAFGGLTWEEVYSGQNTCFSYLELLKCNGVDFNRQPSIYDENALRGTTTSEMQEYSELVQEWDLKGMPTKTNLSEGIVKPEFFGDDSLSQKELLAVQNIKDYKDADKMSAFAIIKMIISIIGFLLITYGLLLVIAYVFDRANSFIDLSMVGFLTFGKMKIVSKDDWGTISDETKKSKGYMTVAKLFMISFIIILVGSLMVSGLLSQWVFKLVGGFI